MSSLGCSSAETDYPYRPPRVDAKAYQATIPEFLDPKDCSQTRPLTFEPASVAWMGEGKEAAAQEFFARAHAILPTIDKENAREFLANSNGDVSLAIFRLRCKLGNGIQYNLIQRSLPEVLDQFVSDSFAPAPKKQITAAEWKSWINSVNRALHNRQRGASPVPVTLDSLRKLMAQGLLVCSPPTKQTHDSLGIDGATYQKATQAGALLKARLEHILLVVAKCYDCLSGFPKRSLLDCNQVLGEMGTLKIDISYKKYLEAIVGAGLEWQKRVRGITMPEASAPVSYSLAELIALADKGRQMDFEMPEDMALLQAKIGEAEHLQIRTQRLMHLGLFAKRRPNVSRAHPTRSSLRVLVKEVGDANVSFPSYLLAKELLHSADQWTAKVQEVFKDQDEDQRVPLSQLNSLHNQAVGMRVDLTEELTPVLKKIEAAKGWISKVMYALPSRKTRSRLAGETDKDSRPRLDQLEGLVKTAGGMGVDVDQHVGKMSELITSAQNWVATMRELLSHEDSDDDDDTLHTLVTLLQREKSIPVEIPEAQMLSAEVNGRLWSDKVAKLLGLGRYKPAPAADLTSDNTDANTNTNTSDTNTEADAPACKKTARPYQLRQLLVEAEEVRATVPLPKHRLSKWRLRYQDQAQALMDRYDTWNAEANRDLKVTECTPLESLLQLVDTAKTLPLSLGKKLEQIQRRVTLTQEWEARASQMNEDRVFPASELRKFCRETENSAHLGTKATLERLRDTLAKFETWTKTVEIASRVKSSNRHSSENRGGQMPSMNTLLELVEHGEKSFKLLDVSKWMGLLQNKMAILASWKEKALATIARCRDIYRLPEAPLDDAAQRDVCVIVQGPALSHSTKQKALRLERISIPRLPDHSFSISSVDLHSRLEQMLKQQAGTDGALVKTETANIDASNESPPTSSVAAGDDAGTAGDASAHGDDGTATAAAAAAAAANNGGSTGASDDNAVAKDGGGDGTTAGEKEASSATVDGDVGSVGTADASALPAMFVFTLRLAEGGRLQIVCADTNSVEKQRHQIEFGSDVLLFVVFVQLDDNERKSVTSELSEYDFSAIGSNNYGKSSSRFDSGCTFLTPEFLSKRIMTAVDTLAADMAIEIEAAIMQGNNINIAAPELDTLLHLRAEIDRAKELGDLFSSTKKISLKKLRDFTLAYTKRHRVRYVFDISLPVLGHEGDGVRQWHARSKLALQKNKPKASREEFEALDQEATRYVVEIPDITRRINEQLTKSSQLIRRCKMCLTKRPPKSEKFIVGLVKEGKKLRVKIPELAELQKHLDESDRWQNDLRASGIEQGDASVEELRTLLSRSRSIQVDLRVYTRVLEKATVEYCLCRKGTKGFMISCEICNEWYHGDCLNVQQRHVKEKSKYVCVLCRIIQSTDKAQQVASIILEKVQAALAGLSTPHPAVTGATTPEPTNSNDADQLLKQHKQSIQAWLESYRRVLATPLPRGVGDMLKKKKVATETEADKAGGSVEEDGPPAAKRARKVLSRKARRDTVSKAAAKSPDNNSCEETIDYVERERQDAQAIEQLRQLGCQYEQALEQARRHSVPPFPAPAAAALFTTCDPHSPLSVCMNIRRWAGEALYHLPRPSIFTLEKLGQLLRFLELSKTKPYWPVKTIAQPLKAIHRRATRWCGSVKTAFKGGANTKMSRLNTLLAKAPSVPFKGVVEDLSSRLLTAIQDGKRYCVCRGFNDGSEMICCDECDKWFHVGCTNHDPTSNAEFRCPNCQLKRQRSEAHKRMQQQQLEHQRNVKLAAAITAAQTNARQEQANGHSQMARTPLAEAAKQISPPDEPPAKRAKKSPEHDGFTGKPPEMPALLVVSGNPFGPQTNAGNDAPLQTQIQVKKEEAEMAAAPSNAESVAAKVEPPPLQQTIKTETAPIAPVSSVAVTPVANTPLAAAAVTSATAPAAAAVTAVTAPAANTPLVAAAVTSATPAANTPLVAAAVTAVTPAANTPLAAAAVTSTTFPVAAAVTPAAAPAATAVTAVTAVPVQSHPIEAARVEANLMAQHLQHLKQHQQRQLEQLQQFHQLQQLQQLHQQLQQQQLQQQNPQEQQEQQQEQQQQEQLQ